jgi:hypothetical protein
MTARLTAVGLLGMLGSLHRHELATLRAQEVGRSTLTLPYLLNTCLMRKSSTSYLTWCSSINDPGQTMTRSRPMTCLLQAHRPHAMQQQVGGIGEQTSFRRAGLPLRQTPALDQRPSTAADCT